VTSVAPHTSALRRADSYADLAQHIAAEKLATPKAYLRDIAARLDVSEQDALLATTTPSERTRLKTDWPALVTHLEALGCVKTMTRNEYAVIEREGTFGGTRFFGAMGQVISDTIDLRLFVREWGAAWAVSQPTPAGTRRSVQIFDTRGDSVHKVFIDDAAEPAYAAVVAACRDEQQDAPLSGRRESVVPVRERPDSDVDILGLHAQWDAMTDTHQFHGMLRSLDVTRTQALRLAGRVRALPVSAASAERLLLGAAAQHEKIMIFVGNRGIIQIFIGAIDRVVRASGWLNILDPGFNLHLRDTAIAQAWVVTKRSADGPIRSLELFDAEGGTIAQFFGKRSEGQGSTPPGFGALLDTVLAECAA
jgi:putative hemin transport protein